MTTVSDAFVTATTVIQVDEGRYEAAIHPGWDIGGNANGGYLLALVGRAITAATGKPDLVTITGHYLAPGRPGDVTIDVDVLRLGSRHATAAAVLTAGGTKILAAVATTTDIAAASGPEYLGTPPPPLPEPDDCVPVEPTDTFPPPFMGRVDLRLHPDGEVWDVDGRLIAQSRQLALVPRSA